MENIFSDPICGTQMNFCIENWTWAWATALPKKFEKLPAKRGFLYETFWVIVLICILMCKICDFGLQSTVVKPYNAFLTNSMLYLIPNSFFLEWVFGVDKLSASDRTVSLFWRLLTELPQYLFYLVLPHPEKTPLLFSQRLFFVKSTYWQVFFSVVKLPEKVPFSAKTVWVLETFAYNVLPLSPTNTSVYYLKPNSYEC